MLFTDAMRTLGVFNFLGKPKSAKVLSVAEAARP